MVHDLTPSACAPGQSTNCLQSKTITVFKPLSSHGKIGSKVVIFPRFVSSRCCLFTLAIAASVLGIVAVTPRSAMAKVSYACPYTSAQAYSASLRLLRVDHGFDITERDPDAAYILFEYKSNEGGSRVSSGAIEIIEKGKELMVQVSLPKMPQYHERVLLDNLRKKLESEYGEPPVRKDPRKEPPKKSDPSAPKAPSKQPSKKASSEES